jgi:hypothetical protein
MLLSCLAALAAALLWAPAAQATFHLISIREVYPGSAAHPGSGYVELQMYAAGQSFVAGHALTVYDASGTATGSFTFGADVSNAADQQTILIGDSGVQSTFGVAPDLTVSGIGIAAAGGAACWAGSIDCAAWGSFAGSTLSPTGSPADPLGIPDGMALRRTIAPGCATLLEATDDRDDSAADFADAAPSPRNNSSPIVETACPPPPDTTPPTATIDSHPADPSPGASAAFTYHSSESGSSFECSLVVAGSPDSFSACPATGRTYAGLADGAHVFKVRATDLAGNQGKAAVFQWTVDNSLADTTPPQTTILSHPPDPSESSTAAFTYESSEPGSTFECRLDGAPFASCPAAGISYAGLANGSHAFEVRAIDAAANVDPTPAGYSFDVAAPSPSPAAPPAPVAVASPVPVLAPSSPPAAVPRHHHRRHRCRRGRHHGNRHGGRHSRRRDKGCQRRHKHRRHRHHRRHGGAR